MSIAVYLGDDDAAIVEAALLGSGVDFNWRGSPYGLGRCSDPIAVPADQLSRRVLVDISRAELVALLRNISAKNRDSYLDALAADIAECSDDL